MGADLQDGDIGPNPHIIANRDWLPDAVPLAALVQPHGICFTVLAVSSLFPGRRCSLGGLQPVPCVGVCGGTMGRSLQLAGLAGGNCTRPSGWPGTGLTWFGRKEGRKTYGSRQ
jgi:hypothetical protein